MGGNLSAVLAQLREREPILHHREFVNSAETFDRETDEGFWEVGASGPVYSRDFVRRVIVPRCEVDDEDEMRREQWTT